MPNYIVNHTILGPGPTDKNAVAVADSDRRKFEPGDVVSEKQLTDAGFDIDRLVTAKPGGFSAAIIKQAGAGDTVAPPSPTPAASMPEAKP